VTSHARVRANPRAATTTARKLSQSARSHVAVHKIDAVSKDNLVFASRPNRPMLTSSRPQQRASATIRMGSMEHTMRDSTYAELRFMGAVEQLSGIASSRSCNRFSIACISCNSPKDCRSPLPETTKVLTAVWAKPARLELQSPIATGGVAVQVYPNKTL
jgi:hypothetical protein